MINKFTLSAAFCLFFLSVNAFADLRYLEFVNRDWSQTTTGEWRDSTGASGTYEVRISLEHTDDTIFIKREYTWANESLVVLSEVEKNGSGLNTIYNRPFSMNNGVGNCRPGFTMELVESMRCRLSMRQGQVVSEFFGLHISKINHTATMNRDGVLINFTAMRYFNI